ncbi:hypothetical protein Q3W71_18205 [Micromonospora sp. C28SCA-DRY-2]|uniref:hypothetical protein n=1 Tax=Micromonospora sp. C28SCA-DRY-2 TaxID=3059522 RepID=UPI0026768710|nr:hypothetical protein [Micromonospora sp. C28SCA-DRY-2]MDO3703602.1 hypothetical protein [Micromonospora sp. C28SCA-DRY-2]
MRATLPACPDDRTGRRIPRLALVATAVLTVPAFLVGPSAASPGGTTPAATTATSSIGTASTGAGSPAASSAVAPAPTASSPAAAPTPTPAPAVEPTAEPTRTRTAKVSQRPWNSRAATCGGELAFGEVETCPSIVDQQEHRWRVTTTADQDVLLTQLGRSTAGPDHVNARVTDAAGRDVCRFGIDAGSCQLGAAGTYTIALTLSYPTGRGDYTIAVESTRTPSTCERLPAELFHFGSPGVTRTLPAGAAAQCHEFDQPLNALVRMAVPGGPTDIRGRILDGQHQPICEFPYGGGDCRLGRPGPYRLLTWETYGTESTYPIRMRRLSDPAGCTALPLAPFGDPGAAVGSGSMQPDDITCHTLTTGTPRPVLVRAASLDGTFGWTMLDNTGQEICSTSDERYCTLPAAGAYTLVVGNPLGGELNYEVAVTPLDRLDGCAPASDNLAWDQPVQQVRQTSPVQTNCQPFQGRAGDRILASVAGTYWLVDQSGARTCTSSSNEVGCVVPADGTYRVLSHRSVWNSGNAGETYPMTLRRISDPVGCPTVRPGAYNAPPSGAPSTIPCRILDIPSTGEYRVKALHGENLRSYARVLDTAGRTLCAEIRCQLPTGRYTLLATDALVAVDVEIEVSLLPLRPAGCTPIGDTGWRDAPHRGRIQTSGQVNCLQLPTPAGAHLGLLLPVDATWPATPDIRVVDANGEPECDFSPLNRYNCELTGPAPYSVLLTGRDWVTSLDYVLGFTRTDGPACPVLPTDATGSVVATGPDRFAVCYSIPADQHAAREALTWARTSGSGRARLTVFNSAGWWECGADAAAQGSVTCDLPAGPLTVLLETDARDAAYQVGRRDAAAGG